MNTVCCLTLSSAQFWVKGTDTQSPAPPESKQSKAGRCPGPAVDPTGYISSVAIRGVCRNSKATDPLSTLRGCLQAWVGSQAHTCFSQSPPTKRSGHEQFHQGQSELQCLGSILPVKVEVNVPPYHQLEGYCPHLSSAHEDQQPTGNSLLYGPPKPLCLCLQIAPAYSTEYRNKTK